MSFFSIFFFLRLMFFYFLEISVFVCCLEIRVFFSDFFEISGEPYFNEPAAKSEKKLTRQVGF